MTRRPRHSLVGAFAVGALLSAVAVVIMILLSRPVRSCDRHNCFIIQNGDDHGQEPDADDRP